MSGTMAKDNLQMLLKSAVNSPSDYARVSREVEKIDSLTKIKVAFLSSYTSEVLNPYIVVDLAKKGYKGSLYYAPFNQFEQEIYNTNSGLYSSNPSVVVIHSRIEDTHRNLIMRFAKYSADELKKIFIEIISRHQKMLEELRNKIDAKIILINFGNSQLAEEYFFSSPIIQEQQAFIQKLNNSLLELSKNISSCFVVDYQQVFANIGFNNSIDPKLDYMARIPFNSSAQIAFGKTIARTIFAMNRSPAKCIVLDLDNTLWGGVIGEDGMSGIKLGDEYPGNVYKNFQRAILGLRDQGVLLSIASKNNLNDALDVFENHTGCLLKKSDFSSIQINWENKASSIIKISEELNIGLDSIVFFDDNPVERDWVKSQLPDVMVIEVPKNPMNYTKALFESKFFDTLIMTNEDRVRANIYHEEQLRKRDLSKAVSLDDFLRELKIKIKIGNSDDTTIARIEQLLNKTNQFNLTTKRYSSSDIIKILSDGGKVLWLSSSDRYGDNGIVGVAILKEIKNKKWLIDSILLSCRVIGRKIETAFLAEIINILKNENANELYGQYLPTKKNHIVSDFYKMHSFKLVDKKNNFWKLNLSEGDIIKPIFIQVIRDV